MINRKNILIFILAIAAFSCKKEYITNEYITNNEYVTNETVYTNKVYLSDSTKEIMTDIRPEYLKKGDTVAVFAASNAVTETQLTNGIKTLESWGLVVAKATNLYGTDGRFAGTQAERISGLQKLVDNKHIKAIIAARGGYGATQVGQYIDWKAMKESPKWLVGFSDVTYFHAILNNQGIETIHGAMVNNLVNSNSVETLRKALFGELKSHSIATNKNCIEGEAEGRLVGGNLTLIYSLGGTAYDLNVRNSILLIEDTGEANYNIDRMMNNLKQSGKLDNVKGIIVGEFINNTQGSDRSIEEIMKEHLGSLGIPVIYGMNIGHDSENLAVYLGRQVNIKVDSKNSTITFK